MASLNKVLLIGNLTRNPELRYTPSGTAVCDLGLAVNRNYTLADGSQKKDTLFVDINVWGHQAESASRYLQKGSSVFIEGRLHLETWEDKEKVKKSKYKVVAERVQFLGSRNQGTGDASGQYGDTDAGGISDEYEQQQPASKNVAPSTRQQAPQYRREAAATSVAQAPRQMPQQARQQAFPPANNPPPMPLPENDVFEVDDQQGEGIPF